MACRSPLISEVRHHITEGYAIASELFSHIRVIVTETEPTVLFHRPLNYPFTWTELIFFRLSNVISFFLMRGKITNWIFLHILRCDYSGNRASPRTFSSHTVSGSWARMLTSRQENVKDPQPRSDLYANGESDH